jgi:predicted DNA-binding transcriptional regulator AlpA
MSDLLNEHEVAEILRVKSATLQAWRYYKTGPAYIRVGRLIRYLREDVEQWAESRRYEPAKASQ